MKNILFITDEEIHPTSGGIERVVDILSRALTATNRYKCYAAYINEYSKIQNTTEFVEKIKLTENNEINDLSAFIERNNIDIILNNQIKSKNVKHIALILRTVADKHAIKIYYVYHTRPSFELIPTSYNILFNRLVFNNKITSLKDILSQITVSVLGKSWANKLIRNKYQPAYLYSDKVILLSEKYIPIYAELVKAKSFEKFIAIPNALTFNYYIQTEELNKKQKHVLIVARLDEKSKRITFALKIWKIIEKTGQYQDWKLIIVGTGEDEVFYKKIATKLKLKQVQFVGKQNSEPYYRDASIYMMTSSFEGFPMTIGESMQMGLVPIAFNSFEAIYDLIEHNKNGIIVPNNNILLYADYLMSIMKDQNLRNNMANCAIDSCKKFKMESVIKHWVELFETSN